MTILKLFIIFAFACLGSYLLQHTSDVHLLRAGSAAVALAAFLFGIVAGQELERQT